MRRLLVLTWLALLALAQPAAAEIKIGVAMAKLDGGFLDLLRDAMIETANKTSEASVDIVVADNDADKQMQQVRAFIDRGVDALILHAASPDITDEVNTLTAEANIPLVYVNRPPPQLSFPGKVSIVACNELVAGRVQMRMLSSLSGGSGNVVLLTGPENHSGAIGRTTGVKEVIDANSGLRLVHQSVASWSVEKAEKIVLDLLNKGTQIDMVAANNDKMAIGAIQAFEKAGVSLDTVVVGGVDGTPAGLNHIKEGKMEISLLQSAPLQAEYAIKDAIKLAKGEFAQQYDWVPYKLIKQENLGEFLIN